MKAPAKKKFPIATNQTLVDFDAFLFGFPTRFGNMPAQMKVRFFYVGLFIHSIHIIFCLNRHFGMLLAAFGLVAVLAVNMPVCLYLLGPLVEAKNLPSSTSFRHLPITVSSTFLLDTLRDSTDSSRWMRFMEVSQTTQHFVFTTINDIVLLVGSPWGAGTFSSPDNSRKPTKRELDIAESQGRAFYDVVSQVQRK